MHKYGFVLFHCVAYKKEKSDFSPFCDSEAIRTLDPRLRRALLYPAELRNRPYVGTVFQFRLQR